MNDAGGRQTDRVSERLAVTPRAPRNGLIAAECQRLTGGTPDVDGVANCDTIERISRAAFVHSGIEVLARATTLDQLVERVQERWTTEMDADRFRIDVHDPSSRCSSTTIEMATALADVIPFGPDLRNPLHRFLVIIGEDGFTFGTVQTEADGSYRLHDDKPWTTSSSLDSRFSRALVNLVPDAASILDPCCGAGSIVLEAASLGLNAFGVDWKPALVGMTRANLAHFGYDAGVELADSRTHVQPADAVVTDLPYGHAIDSDEHEIRAILELSATQAPLGVFVAPADISAWLTSAGYTDIEVHTVLKRRGFTRWIHLVRSQHWPRV
jgi:tRNA G10  N-methylase Trm11